MSIATDEAAKKYSRDVELTVASENNICRRTGYIAGRTAEPTEAEISAAARVISIEVGELYLSEASKALAIDVLDAARKVVSE